jgi:A/G-specific adenine glycosylase
LCENTPRDCLAARVAAAGGRWEAADRDGQAWLSKSAQGDAVTMKLEGKELAKFRRRLLGWFRRHKRDLPWRRTRDPYRIWLSEVMLQQTRVAAVLPYYRRFLRRFPSVRALARARSDEVLRHWAGLGYYSRARNLHHAAQEIVAQHAGRFPREREAALALPGIGRYTTAAVLSIAYGEPLAVLDGNVARVLARLDAVRGDLRAPQRWDRLQQRAQFLLAPNAAGDWNQALMELGAAICTPQAPRCDACPVARWCRAYAEGIAGQLPTRRRKRAPVPVRIAAAVLLDPRGQTLLVRPAGELASLFSRMWQFPAVEAGQDAAADLAQHLLWAYGLRDGRLVALRHARHAVTYRRITLLPFLVRVSHLPRVAGARRLSLADLGRLSVSSSTRKIAMAARGARGEPLLRQDAALQGAL